MHDSVARLLLLYVRIAALLFLLATIVALFVVVICLVVNGIIDFWRIWYGTVILATTVVVARKFWLGPRIASRYYRLILVLLLVWMPYGVAQFQINNGNLQFLSNGTGIWKCDGNYQWFWSEGCRGSWWHKMMDESQE